MPGLAQEATPPAPACPAATPEATPVATPTAVPCVSIELHDTYFAPNLITIPADTPVQLVLVNRGATPRTCSITDHGNPGLPNLDVSLDIPLGETATITVEAPAGLYYFFCAQGGYEGHEEAGERGYLDVKAGAAIATAEGTATPRAE